MWYARTVAAQPAIDSPVVELTTAQIEQFRNDGVLILERLLAMQEVSEARARRSVDGQLAPRIDGTA